MSNSTSNGHQYPPPINQTQTDARSETTNYYIHTETNGISDLRLQVSNAPSSSASRPLWPIWFRERMLTERNEMVDQIVDSTTGKVSWSVHRPSRGWDLYLKSPSLPPGAGIALRPTDSAVEDPSISPLTFTIQTKINQQALVAIKSSLHLAGPSAQKKEQSSEELSRVSLDGQKNHARALSISDAEGHATGRTVPVHVSTELGKGHVRRRSAAGLGTHATGTRKFSTKFENTIRSSTISEDGSQVKSPALQALSRYNADQPYSPVEPKSFGGKGKAKNSTQKCTFVLCDGARRPTLANPTVPIQLDGKQGWARWMWALFPKAVRPVLSLETNKSFSIWWIDPPQGAAIEVLHFEDESGWWMWDAGSRGRLSMQTKAVEAIGLQMEFWIAAALAYLDYLEGKDGYQAASQG